VTGHRRQEILNDFLTSKIQASEKAASGNNIPSNSQNVEEHRPEAVVVEVSGLFERRPVSNLLQSESFRRDLERIVRGSVSEFRRVSAREPTAVVQAQAASGTSSRTSFPAPRDVRNVSTAQLQRISRSRASSLSSGASSQPTGAVASQPTTETPPSRPETQRLIPPPPPAAVPPIEGTLPVGPGTPWLGRVPVWHVQTNREELTR
jgi:hypothetical protein